MNSALNMAFQLNVAFVFGLDVKSLADGKSSVLKILLDVQANSHVVVTFIVVFVCFYGLLVIIDCLFEDADGKVCVREVFEKSILLLILQTALKNDNRLGIAP